MTVLNIISGNLAASIPDHLLQFLAGPNIFSIPVTSSSKYMKETCQNLIKKILYLNFFLLTKIIFCFHQTNIIKVFLKSLSLYLTITYL